MICTPVKRVQLAKRHNVISIFVIVLKIFSSESEASLCQLWQCDSSIIPLTDEALTTESSVTKSKRPFISTGT